MTSNSIRPTSASSRPEDALAKDWWRSISTGSRRDHADAAAGAWCSPTPAYWLATCSIAAIGLPPATSTQLNNGPQRATGRDGHPSTGSPLSSSGLQMVALRRSSAMRRRRPRRSRWTAIATRQRPVNGMGDQSQQPGTAALSRIGDHRTMTWQPKAQREGDAARAARRCWSCHFGAFAGFPFRRDCAQGPAESRAPTSSG